MSDSFYEHLQHNKTLTCLNISENALWETEMNALTDVLATHGTLTSLNLKRTHVLENCLSGVYRLINSMSSSSNGGALSILNVSDCNMCEIGTSLFFGGVGGGFGVGVGVGAGVSGGAMIHRLISLDLSGNDVNDSVALICGAFLEGIHSSQIQTLKFRRKLIDDEESGTVNVITCAGFIAIINAATNCPSLTHIDVSGHRIRNAGCIRLSEVLFQTSIIKLNMSHNRIGDRGVTPLALQLRSNCTSCVSVELVRNPVSAEIADLVRTNV